MTGTQAKNRWRITSPRRWWTNFALPQRTQCNKWITSQNFRVSNHLKRNDASWGSMGTTPIWIWAPTWAGAPKTTRSIRRIGGLLSFSTECSIRSPQRKLYIYLYINLKLVSLGCEKFTGMETILFYTGGWYFSLILGCGSLSRSIVRPHGGLNYVR